MEISKINLMKLIRFSPSLLIQKNIMFFMKIGKEEQLLVKDLLLSNLETNRNKMVFISKDIKNEIENIENKIINIDLDNKFLSFGKIKIELMNTVVKYGIK